MRFVFIFWAISQSSPTLLCLHELQIFSLVKLKRSSDEGDEWGGGRQQSHEGDILKFFQMRFLFFVREICCAKSNCAKLVEPAPNENLGIKRNQHFLDFFRFSFQPPCDRILKQSTERVVVLVLLEESIPGRPKSLKIPFRVTSQLLCPFL